MAVSRARAMQSRSILTGRLVGTRIASNPVRPGCWGEESSSPLCDALCWGTPSDVTLISIPDQWNNRIDTSGRGLTVCVEDIHPNQYGLLRVVAPRVGGRP